MAHNSMHVILRLLLYVFCFFLLYPVLMFWLLPLTFERTRLWHNAASFLDVRDFQSFILTTILIVNIVIAYAIYYAIKLVLELRWYRKLFMGKV